MEHSDHTDEQVKIWERHISTIASALVILLLGWMGSSVVNMGKDISVIKIQLSNALDIKFTLDKIQGEYIDLNSKVIRIDSLITRLEQAQILADKRERKEQGQM